MRLGVVASAWVMGCGGGGSTPPTPVPLTGVAAISAGGAHACAVLRDRTAGCWGSGTTGELGSGASLPATHPIVVPGLSNVAALASGGSFTCALLGDRSAVCWGDDAWGQLGNGAISLAGPAPPGPVSGVAGVVAVGARGPDLEGAVMASDDFACAVLTDGSVDCWGANTAGELGLGVADPNGRSAVPMPGPVTGVTGASSTSLGGKHACAVLAAGEVTCWGSNVNGQLGDGTIDARALPVTVAGLTGPAVAVAGGAFHTCALLADATVACWGGNVYGQLGNGSTVDSLVPVTVIGLTDVVVVTAGTAHTCALRADGTIWCWGFGLLGDGGLAGSPVAVKVRGVTDASAISAGEFFTCALRGDGSVACWGANRSGQLGDGSTIDGAEPAAVTLAPGP